MSKNFKYYMMMAASVVGQELTPVECDMLNKFLRADKNHAE